MYARVITFSGAGSDKRDAALEMIRGTVVPMLRTFDGYEGYILLTDEDRSRAQGIVLWDSEDAANAAEEKLAERRKEMVSQVGTTIESVDLYEAPIVELEGARV
jgi:hypothetical protein